MAVYEKNDNSQCAMVTLLLLACTKVTKTAKLS